MDSFIFIKREMSPIHPKGSGCIRDKEKPANVVFTGFSYGAGSRTRTGDLRITNALLYQLSHTSIVDFYKTCKASVSDCVASL